ncbi:MAG: sugar phosphate isomerase/epimerase family protein, partial [Byssovorax sp.]
YRHPIEEVMPLVRGAGFDAIEISTAPPHLDVADPARVGRVRELADGLGLRVHSLHAPFGHDVNITSPDEGARRAAIHRLTLAADALAALGGALYVIHPGGEDQRWVWDRERCLAASVAGLTAVWTVCRERGLTLAVETPLPHLLGGLPADFAWILERLPPEGTTVCIDTSHCSLGGTLLDSIAANAGRIGHVQASDNRGHTDDHLLPGKGILDWSAVRAALEAASFDGVFMLEVTGEGDLSSCLDGLAAWRHGVAPTQALRGPAEEAQRLRGR